MNRLRPLKLAILLNLLLCATFVTSALAAPTTGVRQNVMYQEENPLVCIDSWTGVHLASLAASIVLGKSPLPWYYGSIIADGAAHSANVALKYCVPYFEAPPDIVFRPSTCSQTVRIPISRDELERITLDKQILLDLLQNPNVDLPNNIRNAIQVTIDSEYGQFEHTTTGDYSNIYFIVIPILSNAHLESHWGGPALDETNGPSSSSGLSGLGAPEIYHFNSDVLVSLTHPGERTSIDEVTFGAGTHTLEWSADTLLSGADLVWIPDVSGFDEAAKRKAQKQTTVQAWKQTIKGWIKSAKEILQKEGPDAVSDVAKKQAKKSENVVVSYGKKKLAQTAAKKSIGFILDTYFLTGNAHGRTTVDYQRIYVIDENAPTISGNTPVTVEALEPGGVSSGNHMNALMQQLTVTDDCDPTPQLTYNTPAFWPLSLQADGSSIASQITWTASDNGAAGPTGGVNSSSVTQQVTVVDTKPPILVAPPPVVMEATASDVMTVALGSPQVFDVADLRTSISNDAPQTFTQGVYRINWRATDFSGNVSAATKDTVQIVNLKEPGTNVLPTAFDQTGANAVNAVSYEPVKITVRGQDGDPQPDPLWFSIENQPANGFFIAPLYPYFIDDFRMAARYSPWIAARDGEEVAWQVAQDTNAMHNYMKQLCEEDINRTDLPIDFVSNIEYLAVDDAGYTYIYDEAYRKCSPGGSTVAPYTRPRISVWDQDGNFFGEQERDEFRGGPPLRSMKFNIGRGTIITTRSDGSSTGSSLVNISKIQPGNAAEPVVDVQTYALWNKVNNILVGNAQTSRRPELKNAGTTAFDNTNKILYVTGEQNLQGMAAFRPAPCESDPNGDPEACLNLLGVQVYSISIVQSTKWDEFPGIGVDAMRLRRIVDIELDSDGAVYIAAEEDDSSRTGFHRIHKFAPATVHADGSVTLGDYIGWLGKCDSGPNCDYVNKRSIGFSCTNDSCFIDEGGAIYGDRAGQFNVIAAIAFDPNDVLYVGDGGNRRVQRFSHDGLFAGQAQSSGDGSSFVLGDFAGVSNIAVNRGSFYILDTQREIVHIFDAAVIHGLDEKSAWVEYQSQNNFVGTDSFTFSATDGFRNAEGETLSSPPATVQINVARNHRPPEATAGLAISVTEDTPTALLLEGYDIDGSLDTLTFQVASQPADGALSGTPPNLTYTPRANFDHVDGFTFTVSDGRFTSAPEEFLIQMVPVNDAPEVTLENEEFRAGVHFPYSLQGTVLDPEVADDLTVTVDWGDGVVESEGAAQNDGTLSGPVVNQTGVVTRTLLAYHTYKAAGSYNLVVTVSDPAGATDVVNQTITVEQMADLAITRRGVAAASPTRLTLTYELNIANLSPENAGASASGVTVVETLGSGLTYRTAVSSAGACQASGQNLSCTLNSLAAGASAKVQVVVDVASSLSLGTTIATASSVRADQADPLPENNAINTAITMLKPADFLVDSPIEGADLNPGDGLCVTAEGSCTLRAAIQEANALPGTQSIALDRTSYLINLTTESVAAAFLGTGAVQEDAAATGDLDITDSLALLGLSADQTILNANGEDRVIEVHNGATVSLEELMLTGGRALDNGPGGGLHNVNGTVTLRRVSVVANHAGSGGGIANSGGAITLVESAILDNSTIEGGGGGGILNQAMLTVENVTISGNQSGTGGGLQALGGTATLRNVTLVGNRASGAGGGINNGGAEDVQLVNTIVANNSAEFGPVCGYTFTSDGHNLFDNLADCTVLGATSSNIVDASFSLEGVTLNGANTYAYVPSTGSRIIDAGSCELAVDQRGVTRPQGNGCDIGAVEWVEGESEEVVLPPISRSFKMFLPLAKR